MNKKELYHFLPSLVFLVVLGVLALLLFFGPDTDYSANEKRYLAGRPEITVSNILKGKTQEELEEFTADQIPGRNFFVGVNAYWNLATGRNAAQSIYHGKDGYLINAPKAYNEEVFTNNLTRFDQFAQSVGIPADMIMVPSTGYLMQNELPAFHGTYDDDMLYEKAGEILQYTHLIDVRDALKEGIAAGGQVCYRTDHHLTSLGNYLLYRAYQIDQGRSYLSRDAYEVTATDGFYGTTWSGSGYWFTKPDTVEIWDSGIQTKVTLRDGTAEPVYSDSGDAICVIDQVKDNKNTDERWTERIALKEAVGHLTERERKILSMRFFQGKTQMEVSTEIGISQAQVSRLEKNALRQIRKEL